MKIGPLDSQPVVPAPADRRTAPAPAPTPLSAQPSATVALSPTATELAGATTDPTFDSAKVDRISQAMRDGQFKVNPEAIADKLIANATELLARKAS